MFLTARSSAPSRRRLTPRAADSRRFAPLAADATVRQLQSMGSLITLGVGPLEIDWGKNSIFRNHNALFSPADLATARYDYDDETTAERPAYVRSLGSLRRRLGLLGYGLPTLADHYAAFGEPPLPFDQFAAAVGAVDLSNVVPPEYSGESDDLGEFVLQYFRQPEFNKVVDLASFRRSDGEFFENLDPYILLRLLLENPSNRDAQVAWRFADVLDGGWVSEADLAPCLTDEARILVVTEGSSDSTVLSRSAPMVASDIADFFSFVDMSENYPFTGTGNVHRFCQGLARLRILNKVLVVLDNDTAGREAFQLIRALDLPATMRVTVLPDLQECETFRAHGPAGEQTQNVNGLAVSTEMFLDLSVGGPSPPAIRWSAYNDRLGQYQGALIAKDSYLRHFVHMSSVPPTYDLSKLRLLWDHLYSTCSNDVAPRTAV